MSQRDRSTILQDVEYRAPKHTRAFEGDLFNTQFTQPVSEGEQIASHGTKGTDLASRLIRSKRKQHARNNGLLRDIATAAALMDHRHSNNLLDNN